MKFKLNNRKSLTDLTYEKILRGALFTPTKNVTEINYKLYYKILNLIKILVCNIYL